MFTYAIKSNATSLLKRANYVAIPLYFNSEQFYFYFFSRKNYNDHY